jgi:hypothetical protein
MAAVISVARHQMEPRVPHPVPARQLTKQPVSIPASPSLLTPRKRRTRVVDNGHCRRSLGAGMVACQSPEDSSHAGGAETHLMYDRSVSQMWDAP